MVKPPEEGAEVVVSLLVDDDHNYEGGTYWQFAEGQM